MFDAIFEHCDRFDVIDDFIFHALTHLEAQEGNADAGFACTSRRADEEAPDSPEARISGRDVGPGVPKARGNDPEVIDDWRKRLSPKCR